MRVGIMAEFLGVRTGGTATYTRDLLQGLATVGGEHRFFAYVSARSALALVPRAANLEPRLVSPYNAWLRLTLTLPAELARRPVDLLHAQGWGPAWSPCPMVLTVHDLSWENDPAAFPWAFRLRLHHVVRISARRAVRLIASSERTARDLVRVYGVPESRVRTIYPAFDPRGLERAGSAEERARVRARYGLRDAYLLYVGSIEPRKNVDRLIRAYAELRRTRPVPHQLVIAGRALRLAEETLRLPRALGIDRDVAFLGPVPQADLAGLYGGAAAFASLATLEGFGYPPLEAMACGAPTLVADAGSLPEVVGDAALLVDPRQPADVVRALERLLTDDALRSRLRASGAERIRRYDRDVAARQVLGVYEECLRESPRGAERAPARA